jgi:hypothetical protein
MIGTGLRGVSVSYTRIFKGSIFSVYRDLCVSRSISKLSPLRCAALEALDVSRRRRHLSILPPHVEIRPLIGPNMPGAIIRLPTFQYLAHHFVGTRFRIPGLVRGWKSAQPSIIQRSELWTLLVTVSAAAWFLLHRWQVTCSSKCPVL